MAGLFGLYGNALVRDAWICSWEPTPEHARLAKQDGQQHGQQLAQQQAAVLPVDVFREFVCTAVRRFRSVEEGHTLGMKRFHGSNTKGTRLDHSEEGLSDSARLCTFCH